MSSVVIASLGSPPRLPYPVQLVEVPTHRLAVAPKGTRYLVRLRTSKMTPEQASKALTSIDEALRTRFKARMPYGFATEDQIYVFVEGSPFSWAALLAFLPTLLGLIGITIFAVTVWQIVASVPSWIWATLLIGVGLILFGPAIGEMILGAIGKVRGK